jgi:hypothetical protein
MSKSRMPTRGRVGCKARDMARLTVGGHIRQTIGRSYGIQSREVGIAYLPLCSFLRRLSHLIQPRRE